jgi:hypothetical protein
VGFLKAKPQFTGTEELIKNEFDLLDNSFYVAVFNENNY